MAKYMIDGSTLTGMANAIRKVTGSVRSYTPEEMIDAVTTILDSATYILVDENGNEIPAVFVENKTIFDATANDIRIGKVAANQNGVVEGTKEIPVYVTHEGIKLVTAGSKFVIPIADYDYTKLQAIICPFNTSTNNSVCAEKVVIEDNVYNVLSYEVLTKVIKDNTTGMIDFCITNDTSGLYIIRYFTYKEIY